MELKIILINFFYFQKFPRKSDLSQALLLLLNRLISEIQNLL